MRHQLTLIITLTRTADPRLDIDGAALLVVAVPTQSYGKRYNQPPTDLVLDAFSKIPRSNKIYDEVIS